jgi:hypothetical protein
MVRAHSITAHSAYHDLLRLLQDEAVSDIVGTPHKLMRNGRGYWYDMFRVGTTVRNRYLGEDSDEMAARIARHRDIAAAGKERAAERGRLIRLLRSQGLPSLDRETGALLSAMEKSGVFRLGGTVVGTQAFRLYEAELGIALSGSETAQTGDIDIASFERLSFALDDQIATGIADTLLPLEFVPVPSLKGASVWRWKHSRSGTLVEFLTPSFRPEEDIRELPALGVSAQSLHFLNFLIANPIKAAALYRSGVLVQIPRPEAYAIHKLIVADRRAGTDRIKAAKDRLQADVLIRILAEDRPDDLREAHQDAISRGPQWQRHIAASLKRLPEAAARLASL